MIDAVGARAPAPLEAPADRRDPEKIKDAARQFEGLMLALLLRSMRESGEGGWLGTGEDHTADSMMEVAEEHLARTIATQGGIGLASMVVQSLERSASPPAPPRNG
ncbi:MAG: hypothetical protein ACM3ZB_17115 [bacterium]